MYQIFSRSVQGLRSSDTPQLPFPIDLLRRPYNSVALPCDIVMVWLRLQLEHARRQDFLCRWAKWGQSRGLGGQRKIDTVEH